MTLPKLFLPILAAVTCLSGCVYEEYETGYQEPPRVYHGGYVRRDVVVERRPVRYYDERGRGYTYAEPYYEERPRVYSDRRPAPYSYRQPRPSVGGAVIYHDHGGHSQRGETAEERRRREIREGQRRDEDRKDDKKKDDDKKKKRKKKDD